MSENVSLPLTDSDNLIGGGAELYVPRSAAITPTGNMTTGRGFETATLLPDGNVLATFQHAHHASSDMVMGATGGLVEINDEGKVVRSASSADPHSPTLC